MPISDFVHMISTHISSSTAAVVHASDRLAWLYSRVHWLDRYNATLVMQLNEANAQADRVAPLEAWVHGLERELT